jgi:phosphate/sulfate permease
MRQPILRFAMNFAAYLVFGGGIFAFAAIQAHAIGSSTGDFARVIAAALGVAVWCGALTTSSELVAKRIEARPKRALVAASLGALSLGGFAAALSVISGGAVSTSFIAIGAVVGAAMHGARAFAAQTT